MLIINAIIILAGVFTLAIVVIKEVKDIHGHLSDVESRLEKFMVDLEDTASIHREKIAKDQKNVTKQIKRQMDAKEIPQRRQASGRNAKKQHSEAHFQVHS